MVEAYYIGKSPIHGKGIFAMRPIECGETIGLALERNNEGELLQTILSRYTNHSNKPNMKNVPKGDQYNLVALRDVKPDEELVTDYAAFAQIIAPEQVPPMSTAFAPRTACRRITKWIEDNMTDPKNHCFFYAAVLAALFPSLTLMKGQHSKQHKEDTAHFWTEDEFGNIIDPTADQYTKGEYLGGVPISLEANLDEAIKDPMFKTLDSDDQELIIARSAEPLSGRHIGFRHYTMLLPFSKRAKEHAYVEKKKEDSGNVTYLYDSKHIAARNRKKEKRLKKLSGSLKKVRSKVKSDLSSDNEKTRLAALAIALIDETYERVGNEESASELKHYGVTSWMLKHITFGKGKATLKYVGKAGVKQTKEIKTKSVLAALKHACEGKKKGDRILEGISAKNVNAYLTPFHITAKDIRGYHANKEMLRALKANGKPPKGDEKALKEHFKKALTDAAKKVGHEPGTLKRQYLLPRIEQYYMEGKSVRNILASQEIPLSKRAKRHNVADEYIWLWDSGIRRGKGVGGSGLKIKCNVKDGNELKSVDHGSLADELGMSAEDAHEAPRGFVTILLNGSPEVTTYGTPFIHLLDTHPQAYNAVERAFDLIPGTYRQLVLPMPRGSHKELFDLPLSGREKVVEAIPKKSRAMAVPLSKRAIGSLTPQDIEELARQIAQNAIDSFADNAVQTMSEQPGTDLNSFGAQEIMRDGSSVLQMAYDVILDLTPKGFQKGVLRQLLLDLVEAVQNKRFKVPYSVGFGEALRQYEKKWGHTKLNRKQQREIAPDWDALVLSFGQRIMEEAVTHANEGDWVAGAYMPNHVYSIQDSIDDYEPNQWTPVGQKFEKLQNAARENEDASELLKQNMDEIIEKARALVPILVRQQSRSAALSVPFSKWADKPSEWRDEPFWFLSKNKKPPKGYKQSLFVRPHPAIEVPHVILREEEYIKLQKIQAKLSNSVLVSSKPVEVLDNKGKPFWVDVRYMPFQVILKGKRMPATSLLDWLGSKFGDDKPLLDGVVERTKEQRGKKSSYLYDTTAHKQEGFVPYLRFETVDANELNDMVAQTGWPKVTSPLNSIEGGSAERLPMVVVDKHGRSVRTGKLLTVLKKQFPQKVDFLNRIEKSLSLIPRINEWELVVSAEPSDILTMSTGRGWKSCVTEHQCRFDTLDYAVSTRDMVAYAVAPNQNNWIARTWLRSDGKGKWWPESKVYTTHGIASADFFEAINKYLSSKGILGKPGDYHPLAQGWSDQLMGLIRRNKQVEKAQEYDPYRDLPGKPEKSIRYVSKAKEHRLYEVEADMATEEFEAILGNLVGSDFAIVDEKAVKGNKLSAQHIVYDVKLSFEAAEVLRDLDGIVDVREKGPVPTTTSTVVILNPVDSRLLNIMSEHLMDPEIAKVTTLDEFMKLPENTRENILDEQVSEMQLKMPWAVLSRDGLKVTVTKGVFPQKAVLLPGGPARPPPAWVWNTEAVWALPLSKFAATAEEKELTYLYQLTAEALKEVGGYNALEHDWQRSLFDDMAEALWHSELKKANRIIDRILKYIVGDKRTEGSVMLPLSKRTEVENCLSPMPKSERTRKGNSMTHTMIMLKNDVMPAKYLELVRQALDNRPPLSGRAMPANIGNTPGAPPG